MEVERPFFLQGLLCVSRVTIFHAKGIRNRRRVFRLPRRSGKYASVPRFVNPKIISVRIKLRGKSKEGGRSPLLGRFKGVCKGARAPTRIQRSDSCGKRRNNGTDDACPPLAADRMRDVEFVPMQLPLDWFPFHRQRLFLCRAKKKGLNTAISAKTEKSGLPEAFLLIFPL